MLGKGLADQRTLDTIAGLYPTSASHWILSVLGVTTLLIAYLSLRWIRAQFRVAPRLRSLELSGGGDRGTTQVRGSALEHALIAELQRSPGASGARVRLLGDGVSPSLAVRMEFAEEEGASDLFQSLMEGSLLGTSRLLGIQGLPTVVRLVPVAPDRVD